MLTCRFKKSDGKIINSLVTPRLVTILFLKIMPINTNFQLSSFVIYIVPMF